MMSARKPTGWYLGLRYMEGTGLVARAARPSGVAAQTARFIFVDDILLDAEDWRALLHSWWELVAPDGFLILWLTDCRYREPGNERQRVTLDDVAQALDHAGNAGLREADVIEGHAYVVFEKCEPGQAAFDPWRKKEKHALVTRTGAHGDALMAASVLPDLKRQGWTISFISREAGCEVLRHDPHIDELIPLRKGQVEDDEMPHYWAAWTQRFDRFINLTHSVEGELLKHPGRGDYYWSDEQRRKLCNRSYLTQTHELADARGPYRTRFYPERDERIWALREADRLGVFVLWVLRGSAVHKWWPHAPQAICRLLAHSDVNIALAGDAEALPLADKIFAAVGNYHGDCGRVHSYVGTHSIRKIMTLAHYAAVLVGPETGIMHAVCMEHMPKIVMLSHSTDVNLTNDWVNAVPLRPSTGCYPCHRLHYSHEWCPQDHATGAALCAASITVEDVVAAVRQAMTRPRHAPWWQREAGRKAA